MIKSVESSPLYLVITLDVEEEGLFSGSYPASGAGVTNVHELQRLEFIPREFGFPLTLLATYPVAQDTAAREVLISWREKHGAEIGVHLHPWNTPPFQGVPGREQEVDVARPIHRIVQPDMRGTMVRRAGRHRSSHNG